MGLGFAIPVNQAKRVAEELINSGKATHPVIGVTLDLDYADDGARVATPKAGLKAGTSSPGSTVSRCTPVTSSSSGRVRTGPVTTCG